MTKIEFPRKPVAFLGYFLGTLSPWQKFSVFMLVAITASVVSSNILMMYGFKLLVDGIPHVDPAHVWDGLRWPFTIVVLCCAYHGIMYRVREVFDAYSMPDIQNRLRELILGNIINHSHEYFHNRFSGELVNKVANINNAYKSLLWDRFIQGFIPALFSIASSSVLLWFVDPNLTYILIGVVVALCASSYLLGPKLSVASARLADTESDISGQLVDTMTNISSVKNFAHFPHELHLLHRVQRPYISAYRQFAWREIIFWGAFDIIISGLVIGFIYYLIVNLSKNQFSAGDVAACVLVAWDMWWRLGGLSWQLTQLSGDLGRMESALNEFVRPVDITDKAGAVLFAPQNGRIDIQDMTFVYESGRPVFSDFNLVIPASQKVGIVGLSGAGKTTLCQLLLRNYDVASGAIRIGGQNIADVTQESLRRNIAVIPQDPSLFHRSLRENILYGRPDATEAEMIAAAKAAQAHDFILATPEGYNTTVGERGVKLSGGQRQRIAIARAILKNAPVLILDEATSALDSDTERLIQSALDTAMEGRTTLVVAHRLSTLAHLDRIIVMKDGKIIEDGTLQALIALNGHFAYLWNLQAGGFLPEKV